MINKVILIGHVGQDPDVRHTANETVVVNFSLATSHKFKGETQTEWNRCVAFGKLGEIIGQYVKKGSKIYVEGRLQTRSWDKDGVKQYTTEIVVNEMQMLDSRAESAGRDGDARPSENPAGGQGAGKPPQPDFNDFDDSIPF